MNDLVGIEQVSLITRRHTIDNIAVAQEALHSLRKKQGKKGMMLVKINLEKAYDRIWWPFLEVVLERIGIGDTLVKVIMSCISSTRLSVI